MFWLLSRQTRIRFLVMSAMFWPLHYSLEQRKLQLQTAMEERMQVFFFFFFWKKSGSHAKRFIVRKSTFTSLFSRPSWRPQRKTSPMWAKVWSPLRCLDDKTHDDTDYVDHGHGDVNDDCQHQRCSLELRERSTRIELLKKKYEVLLMSIAPSEDGQEHSQVYPYFFKYITVQFQSPLSPYQLFFARGRYVLIVLIAGILPGQSSPRETGIATIWWRSWFQNSKRWEGYTRIACLPYFFFFFFWTLIFTRSLTLTFSTYVSTLTSSSSFTLFRCHAPTLTVAVSLSLTHCMLRIPLTWWMGATSNTAKPSHEQILPLLKLNRRRTWRVRL